MAYQKRNFQKEQLLTAEDMNAMDAQIAENEKTAKSAVVQRGVLTSADNLNNVTEPGMYSWHNNSVPVNSPFAVDCIMIVYNSEDFVVQRIVSVVGSIDTVERIGYYGTWTEFVDDTSGTSGMSFVRTLDASDDLNKIRETGIYNYFMSGIPQNTPFGEQTTAVLVYVMSGDYLNASCPTLQVAVGDNNMMYRANHTTNDDNWKDWKVGSGEIEILQTGGTREDAVMSQKATTDYVDAKVEIVKTTANAAYENASTAIDLAVDASKDAADAKNAVLTAMCVRAELTSDDNIDNITEQGIYSWLSGSPPSGLPTEPETGNPTPRSGILIVYNLYNQSVQVVIEQITARTVVRAKMSYDTTWSDWARSVEVKQTTGESDYYVMSQKAVSELIETLHKRIDSIVTPDEGDSGADYSNVIQTLSNCFTNGVFVSDDPDALKPTPGEGLQLITNPGTVLIEGYSKKMAKNTRTFSAKEEEYVEVYLLRLYTDTGVIERIIREVTVYGDVLFSREDGSELPVRWGGWYDILLSKVTIPAGATQITEDMIEDYRDNNNYCGHVRSKL